MRDVAALLARILISGIFVMGGIMKLINWTDTVGMISEKGLPMPHTLAIVAVATEIVGGVMILFGAYTRLGAPVWAEHCRASVAALTPSSDGERPAFRFDGASWELSYCGHAVHLPDAKGIRDLALNEFGLMARTVFHLWGIDRTDDFGEIVFNLVESRLMSKTDTDTRADFHNVFDLDQALLRDYPIALDRQTFLHEYRTQQDLAE